MQNWKQKLHFPGDKKSSIQPWTDTLDQSYLGSMDLTTSPFVESLSMKSGKIENVAMHQLRFQRSRIKLNQYLSGASENSFSTFGFFSPQGLPNLSSFLTKVSRGGIPKKIAPLEPIDLQSRVIQSFQSWIDTHPVIGKNPLPQFKVRVFYGREIESIDFQIYKPPLYSYCTFVNGDSLSYRYKWCDRTRFQELCLGLAPDAYPIFVKDGLLTDGLTANLVVNFQGKPITPSRPLLEGTCRQRLLDQGLIHRADIPAKNLKPGDPVYFINALNPLYTWSLELRDR